MTRKTQDFYATKSLMVNVPLQCYEAMLLMARQMNTTPTNVARMLILTELANAEGAVFGPESRDENREGYMMEYLEEIIANTDVDPDDVMLPASLSVTMANWYPIFVERMTRTIRPDERARLPLNSARIKNRRQRRKQSRVDQSVVPFSTRLNSR